MRDYHDDGTICFAIAAVVRRVDVVDAAFDPTVTGLR